MIIENDLWRDFDYTFYDLIGVRVRPIRREDPIRRFVKVYPDIRDADTHIDLQKDVMEEY